MVVALKADFAWAGGSRSRRPPDNAPTHTLAKTRWKDAFHPDLSSTHPGWLARAVWEWHASIFKIAWIAMRFTVKMPSLNLATFFASGTKLRVGRLLFVSVALLLIAGCHSVDPATRSTARIDRLPAEARPKDWERTKSLMARTAPSIGQPAPDFSLRTLDGAETITRSVYQADRPLVLIFASFT
jgi:hypothetical protein